MSARSRFASPRVMHEARPVQCRSHAASVEGGVRREVRHGGRDEPAGVHRLLPFGGSPEPLVVVEVEHPRIGRVDDGGIERESDHTRGQLVGGQVGDPELVRRRGLPGNARELLRGREGRDRSAGDQVPVPPDGRPHAIGP